MTLKESFEKANRQGHVEIKTGGVALEISENVGGYSVYQGYNFLTRLLTSRSSDGAIAVIPFSQLDRETLEFFHGMLVELKGNPPDLPKLETTPRIISKKISKEIE